MNLPKISIIMPIYNVEKYLEECLDSVIIQTLKDIEIICVNDGSTDSSLEILKKYAKKDKRIKIITKANSGYGDSMNVGMRCAQGEFIGIVEPDDFIVPEMYEVLYDKAKEFDVDFIKSGYYHYWQKPVEKKVGHTILEKPEYLDRVITDFNDKVFFKGVIAHWSGIYKRKFLTDSEIWFLETPGASYQDTGFFVKAYIAAKSAYFLSDKFYFYRQDNEASSINDMSKVFCLCDEFRDIERYLNERPNKKHLEPIVQYKKYIAYMWNYTRIAPKFKKAFVTKISKEFKLAQKENKLDKKHFSYREWDKLQLLIRHPFVFLLKYKNPIRKNKKHGIRTMDFADYFEKIKAQKQIDKLAKKYKNKKIAIYGAGKYSRELFEAYDFSKLNIVAIADKAFEKEENRDFYGLHCVAPTDLREFECDVILLAVYDDELMADFLEDELLVGSNNSNVEIKPLIKLSLGSYLYFLIKQRFDKG